MKCKITKRKSKERITVWILNLVSIRKWVVCVSLFKNARFIRPMGSVCSIILEDHTFFKCLIKIPFLCIRFLMLLYYRILSMCVSWWPVFLLVYWRTFLSLTDSFLSSLVPTSIYDFLFELFIFCVTTEIDTLLDIISSRRPLCLAYTVFSCLSISVCMSG